MSIWNSALGGWEQTFFGWKCFFGLKEKQPEYGAGNKAWELQERRSREGGSSRDLNGKDILIFASEVPYSNLRHDGYSVCKMPGIKTKVTLSRIS